MKKFTAVYIIFTFIIALILALILSSTPAAAAPLLQVTNTPEPTAITEEIIDIDGTNMVLDQRVTLGDIAIVINLLLIAAILVTYTIFKVVTHYLK